MPKTVLYTSVGPELTLFDIDIPDAALSKRGSVTLPANIQYAWSHPSARYFYVVSSNGGPGVIPGDTHLASAFEVPTVAVFLATKPGLTGPLGAYATTVSADPERKILKTSWNSSAPQAISSRASGSS